jgi:uncharacterized protein
MPQDPTTVDAQSLDILRGLALFGMILVHFHQRMRLDATGLEDLIGWAVYILVEQKSWGVFALLFGTGFAIFLRRLETRGLPVTAVYLRRMAALAAFGVIAEVGFGFHILFTYACWGAVLLLIRHWSSRALLVTAAASAAARPVVGGLLALQAWWTGGTLPPPAGQALRVASATAAEQADYWSLLAARWAEFVGTLPGDWRGLLPDNNFALFIVGLLAVRHGVVDAPGRHRRLIARWMAFGMIAWILAWVPLRHLPDIPIPGAGWPLAAGLGLVQDQWLCLTYAGAVLLALDRWPDWTRRLNPIGQAGRMALTNYLLQAIILDYLASGYGLRLTLRPLLYPVAAVGLFSLVAAYSTVWLRKFRFGPLEWLWRSVTYWKLQPWRRR